MNISKTIRILLGAALSSVCLSSVGAHEANYYQIMASPNQQGGLQVHVGIPGAAEAGRSEVIANGVQLKLQDNTGAVAVFSGDVADVAESINLVVSNDALGLYVAETLDSQTLSAARESRGKLFPSKGIIKDGIIDGQKKTYREHIVKDTPKGSPAGFRFLVEGNSKLIARINYLDSEGKVYQSYDLPEVRNYKGTKDYVHINPSNGGSFPAFTAGSKIQLWLYDNATSGSCNLIKM